MKFIHIPNNIEKKFILDEQYEEYVIYFHNISAKLDFEIVSPNIKLYIYGLFTGYKSKRYEIETIQHHKAPNSFSDLFIRGIFYDSSKFIHKGLIRLEKSAQKSHAYQKNQNLILSPRVFVDSKPYLEILANDVFCTHGSSTGQLNQDQLSYVISRGLNQKNAEKLLADGFISEVYNKLSAHGIEIKNLQ